MEDKVAELIKRVEVHERHDRPRGVSQGQVHDRAATSAQTFWRGGRLERRDEVASAAHGGPRLLAVQRDLHEAERLEQASQHAPPGHRVAQVMQYPSALDERETPSERRKAQDIALAVLDIRNAELRGHARCVAEAGKA